MNALENILSALIAGLGAVALIAGAVTFSIPALVFGAALLLAGLWVRRSLTQLARIEANTREMTRALGLLARLHQVGRRHEDDSPSGPRAER